MKVAQSCPTLWDSMDYTVHGILQARVLEWVAFPFSRGSFQPGTKPRSPVFQTASLLSHKGSPRIPEWVAHPFSSGFFWPRNPTGVSCTAGSFFTNWAMRVLGHILLLSPWITCKSNTSKFSDLIHLQKTGHFLKKMLIYYFQNFSIFHL